jgi:hypothetical protein
VGAGWSAHGAGGRAAAARSPGPHRLGDPCPSQGRPDRLSLAHPPLRRPAGRLPVRGRFRSPGRRAALRGSLTSTSKARTCSGAIAARNAPSTPWSRSSASQRSRSCVWPRSSAALIPPVLTWCPRRPACSMSRKTARQANQAEQWRRLSIAKLQTGRGKISLKSNTASAASCGSGTSRS